MQILLNPIYIANKPIFSPFALIDKSVKFVGVCLFRVSCKLSTSANCCCSACVSTKVRRITLSKSRMIHQCFESEYLHSKNWWSFCQHFKNHSRDEGFFIWGFCGFGGGGESCLANDGLWGKPQQFLLLVQRH